MHSLTSQVDHKIAEGNLALWMQLGVTEPNPGHLVSVCRALLAKSTRSSEPAIQILQSDLGIDPRWKPFAQDLRQRFDLPSVRNCCESAIQTQAFLNASGFPSGELGLQWRSDIRDTRIRLLNPATRAQAWHEARVYDVLHPVVDLLGRVGSRESEVLLQGVEQLRASLLRTASASLLDTSGVDRLAVVVDQFVKRTEMDPDQGGRLFRRLFPELRIQIRSADREMLSRLPEILGGREVLLDPGRLAVYERFRTRSNLLGYAQSLEEWCMRWCEIFPQDRERLETVLQAALAGATDPVLGDDSLKWIELFLDRSKALYPKALESELSEVPWLSRTHSALQEQLADARDRWWKSVLQGDGDAGDLRPFEVLQLIEVLLQADQQLPHGHCVPRSLLKTELQLLQKELPVAMLQTDEQRDVVLARAPLVDLTVRLAKAHPELESDALQAFVRDALELVPDPFAERRADLDYVIRYAIEASLLDERGLELPALQLRQGCAATIRSLQLRYGV
jgi:polyhydroxyalkanoate synthesis regulator phasin